MKPHLEQIRNAAEILKGVIKRTPVIPSPVFSAESGNSVFLKTENLQLTGAFKIRGAYYKISCLSDKDKKKGLIASSAGNHAQGVALAAKMQHVDAVIVMPKTTPLIKVEATKEMGAGVILAGDCYDDAYSEAKRLEEEEGRIFIHPFDDPEIMAGQGTIALEILEDLENVYAILVPVGGGGLISGMAAAVKALKPEVQVIGVEPEGARAMSDSLFRNKLQTLENVETIADGVAVKTPGKKTFPLIKELVDDIITVSDPELMESFLLLLERHKLIAEPSGVLSLAALQKLRFRNKNVVSLISGGNIDVVTVASMIDRGLVRRGRVFCFSAEMPDEPGQLLNIASILAEENANVIKLDHNQFKTLDRFKQVQLEVTVESNGAAHIKSIIKALERGGYTIERIY